MYHILKSNIIENVKKPGESYENLEEKVYKIIKDKIIYHKIKPKERIIDQNIAVELGVSRSLVRQVFKILLKEDLLIKVPRGGFYVRVVTKKEVDEIYNVRKVLESYATELAMPNITEKKLDKIEKKFKKAKIDLEKKDTKSYFKLDIEFHDLIMSKCGNKILWQIIKKYNDRYIFYRVIDVKIIERAIISYNEHLEIFKAIKSKNSKLAACLMAKHLENAREKITKSFYEYTYE